MSGFFRRSTKKFPDCTGPFTVGCADLMFSPSETLKFGSFIRLFYPTSNSNEANMHHENTQALWCPRSEYHHGLARFINMGTWLLGKIIQWTVGRFIHFY